MITGEKLIVFRSGAIDSNSVTSADDGTNIDLCALPASAITSIFAEEDFVYIYFKEAGRFENGTSFGGVTNDTTDDNDQTVMHEIMEQTFVRLGAVDGKELDLVKDFAALATASGTAGNTQVPVFDAVNSVYPINNVESVQIRRHLTAHTIL
tara:strand:+ start:304 stop:759 length:456 start_codon:yes stop_codon:yes gene_type:complete